MSMPFDATLKDLGADHPHDFLSFFDRPPSKPLRPLNVDLSTVSTAADLVVGLGQPLVEIIHIDFQSNANANKDADVLVYNGLLYRHYRVPVHSILVLLRPQAAHSDVNGTINYAARPTRGRMAFGFEIVRLWETAAEDLLHGSIGTLPLAMLGALPEGADLVEGLTGVAQRLMQRLEQETTSEQTKRLLMAAFLLTGLRVKRNVGKVVFAGMRAMRDSDTYLAILDEGGEREARRLILKWAETPLGQPDEQTRLRLEGITDITRLERMLERVIARGATAANWQDLLDTP
jgi:hypothetical protein